MIEFKFRGWGSLDVPNIEEYVSEKSYCISVEFEVITDEYEMMNDYEGLVFYFFVCNKKGLIQYLEYSEDDDNFIKLECFFVQEKFEKNVIKNFIKNEILFANNNYTGNDIIWYLKTKFILDND
ncbi:MAG: hypothetical protein GY827_08995 [Cytophagales bacterium]|nr:hypothetical protein [Cytophagales bacterium]